VQVVVGEQPLDLLGQVARVPGPEPQATELVVGFDGGGDTAVVGDDRGRAVGQGLDGDHAERLPVDRRVDDAAAVGEERRPQLVDDFVAPHDRAPQVLGELPADLGIVVAEQRRADDGQLEIHAALAQDGDGVEQ